LWKKYSPPSAALMNPKPLSLTIRLIVPELAMSSVSLSRMIAESVENAVRTRTLNEMWVDEREAGEERLGGAPQAGATDIWWQSSQRR
jgi:hypothetical protein